MKKREEADVVGEGVRDLPEMWGRRTKVCTREAGYM